jgi:Rps23 Pro-64 3,4-dihydroxylase Tpa1-like proline 4-hydroxylase
MDITPEREIFSYEKWEPRLPALARAYKEAQPFPSIQLENFLNEEIARSMEREFPKPGDISWIHYKHYNEHKLGKNKREEFPAHIGRVVDEFNSPRFTAFMSKLTGISGLMADPSLDGGGMHQTERGGFLNVHADFTMHHYQKQWHRRVNLIFYLNSGWQKEWGGELELWDRGMKQCVARFAPGFNCAGIFNTDESSFHGYPEPIQFPEGVTRRSVAMYYYTLETDPNYVAKSTDYRPRPGEGFKSSALIWADKKAVHCYSVLKKTLGLSDDLAGKLLGVFSRKKK